MTQESALLAGEAFPPELFETEEEEVLARVAQNSMGVQLQMQRILDIRAKQEYFDSQKAEAVAFYEAEKARLDRQIAFLTSSVDAFLTHEGLSELRTPKAKAHYRTLSKVAWPDDDTLLSWAKQTGRPSLVRTKESPARDAIGKYIKETGEAPPGYQVLAERKLYISPSTKAKQGEEGAASACSV